MLLLLPCSIGLDAVSCRCCWSAPWVSLRSAAILMLSGKMVLLSLSYLLISISHVANDSSNLLSLNDGFRIWFSTRWIGCQLGWRTWWPVVSKWITQNFNTVVMMPCCLHTAAAGPRWCSPGWNEVLMQVWPNVHLPRWGQILRWGVRLWRDVVSSLTDATVGERWSWWGGCMLWMCIEISILQKWQSHHPMISYVGGVILYWWLLLTWSSASVVVAMFGDAYCWYYRLTCCGSADACCRCWSSPLTNWIDQGLRLRCWNHWCVSLMLAAAGSWCIAAMRSRALLMSLDVKAQWMCRNAWILMYIDEVHGFHGCMYVNVSLSLSFSLCLSLYKWTICK